MVSRRERLGDHDRDGIRPSATVAASAIRDAERGRAIVRPKNY
jgi:hypothetical protein